MNRRNLVVCSLTGVVVAFCLGATPPASAAPMVAQVSGGGIAVFDVFHPNDPSGVTPFGVGAIIYGDGRATGHFECTIPGPPSTNSTLANTVMITNGTCNGDGSVTIWGPGTVHLAGGGMVAPGLEYITLSAGGAGTAHFTLCIPFFPVCDASTVVSGIVRINKTN